MCANGHIVFGLGVPATHPCQYPTEIAHTAVNQGGEAHADIY